MLRCQHRGKRGHVFGYIRHVFYKIAQAVQIPVVAIGSITVDNVEKLQNTGIAGVAVVSGILGQADIRQASEMLQQKLGKL